MNTAGDVVDAEKAKLFYYYYRLATHYTTEYYTITFSTAVLASCHSKITL
jgi:hypothetical protein